MITDEKLDANVLKKITGIENEILEFAAREKYSTALTELWEAWLTHENTNEVNHLGRSEMLQIFKNLQKLIKSLPG